MQTWLAKAREHLEWDRLTEAVLARCGGDSARRAGVELAADRAQAEVLLSETREALGVLQRREKFPLDDLRDVVPHLQRLERGGALDAAALYDLLVTLRTARAMRTFLSRQREELPALWLSCSTDPALDELEAQLDDALSPDGSLSDHASPELRQLRKEIGNLRERIVGRLQGLIDRYQDVLSDRYYTLREGRYVLPVRRDAHERVPGIVHGTSQSGASVFVEPRPVVAHGNRLKMAHSELEREEQRILASLSELARERIGSLEGAALAIDRMDLRRAAARLGRDLDGHVPVLDEACRAEIHELRHPLLLLDGVDVVDNDLSLAAGEGLVISGPNAGGKTVLLKSLGLAALMTRAGLPLAAREDSRVGFFERVLTDVGDEQSTVKNLSTFSAHITNLAAILEAADGRSLVLLDEVATGTDPQEGAALACALVDTLCEQGAALAVSTHYEPLKAFSLEDTRLRTASVGFDVARMEPSFKLALDVPGASSALAVAQRFGIPADVIARAQRVLPEQARKFDQLVQQLAAKISELEQAQEALARDRARVDELRRKQDKKLESLRRDGDNTIAREVSDLLADVKSARQAVSAARDKLRSDKPDAKAVAEADKLVAKVAKRVALGGDLASSQPTASRGGGGGGPIEEGDVRVGGKVHVDRLRSDAVVLEGPNKGRVRVAVGPLKLWVETGELREPSGNAAAGGSANGDERKPSPTPRRKAERTPDNTVTVRGMRVDDAKSMVETFVDRLLTTDHPVGYVVHGHGSGALRDAIREQLRQEMPHVRSARAGADHEGGDAVTVFELD